ncbi:MAG: hypothetical protein IJU28_07870 [Clostridia bacterium]|nr:hypothetical protein [Clostridia bacterium]
MTFYNWLTLLGVPTIFSAILGFIINRVLSKQTAKQDALAKAQAAQKTETDAIKAGVQAMLRDRLYQLYRFCKKQGYAGEFERENFRNMYNQYHTLGANGVMDDIKDKFFSLDVFNEE